LLLRHLSQRLVWLRLLLRLLRLLRLRLLLLGRWRLSDRNSREAAVRLVRCRYRCRLHLAWGDVASQLPRS
jgi:hypothetical protein